MKEAVDRNVQTMKLPCIDTHLWREKPRKKRSEKKRITKNDEKEEHNPLPVYIVLPGNVSCVNVVCTLDIVLMSPFQSMICRDSCVFTECIMISRRLVPFFPVVAASAAKPEAIRCMSICARKAAA